jgi:uncharacterized protein
MKIDVSEILKVEGALLDIKFEGPLEELNTIGTDIKFENPVNFFGQIEKDGDNLKLSGQLRVNYVTLCFRCLVEVKGSLDLIVNEKFITGDKLEDIEAYAYEGKFIELDKMLIDNIILNIPMKQLCSETCKGLCQWCGSDLNEKSCDCKDDDINPNLEVLKNYFKN